MKMKKLLAMLLLVAILASSTLALAVSFEDIENLSFVKLKSSAHVFK